MQTKLPKTINYYKHDLLELALIIPIQTDLNAGITLDYKVNIITYKSKRFI